VGDFQERSPPKIRFFLYFFLSEKVLVM